MHPNHLALLTVTQFAKSVGGSALPNAPIVDDSLDRRSVGQLLIAFRKRLAELIWPGELTVPSVDRDPALAGC